MIFLTAAIIGVVVPFVTARGWNWFRRSQYRRSRELRAKDLPFHPLLEHKLSPLQEQSRDALAALVREHHARAIGLQDKYHLLLATAVCALFLAFVGIAGQVTDLLTFDPKGEFTGVLDAVSLLVALASFVLSLDVNRAWLVARSRAELLRQWYAVDELLLGGTRSDDLTGRFFRYSSLIDEVLRCDASELTQRIGEIWKGRREEIRHAASTVPLVRARIGGYLVRRPIRQAHWFFAARKRLRRQDRRRVVLLSSLFGAAFVVSAIKVVLAFEILEVGWHSLKSVMTFALLCLIGFSSALTALYVGQNARSLEHRYSLQERHIREVLVKLFSELPAGEDEADALSDPAKSAFIAAVLEFEDLMIEELIDWIEITRHDVLELAP